MRALLVLVGSVCVACGPLTPPKPNGNLDAGSVDGGAQTGGGGSSAVGGGSVGGSGGGGSPAGGGGGGGAVGGGAGGGGSTDAGPGAWEFSSLTLNPAPTNWGAIVGFAETDAGVYAVSTSGRLYRSTGGAFNQVVAFANLRPADIEGTADGHLFIVGGLDFLDCAADCADAGAWRARQLSRGPEALDSLCAVDSSHVLAIGSRGAANDGISYRWNGTTLASTAALLGVILPQNCWRGASGDFFIPAWNAVLRYSPVNESFIPETTAPVSWGGGGSSPGHEWLTGSGPVIAFRGQSSWTNSYMPSGLGATINVVVGISPTLAFAFGGGPSGQAGYRYDGASWAVMNPDLPTMNIASTALLTTNGVLYVGGDDLNYPRIVRGAQR